MKLSVQSLVGALAAIAFPLQLAAKTPMGPEVPVRVGAQSELNACTSIGHGKAALTVRAAPSASARATAKLDSTHLVWICEQRGGAKWYGIVYGAAALSHEENGIPPACGVSEPLNKPKAYRGPCNSGWIPSAAVEMIAG